MGPAILLAILLTVISLWYLEKRFLHQQSNIPTASAQATEKPPTWTGVEVLPGVYDDNAGNAYITRRIIGTYSEINQDLILTKTTWQKKFPQRRIVAMAYAPGDALLIHYEEAPTTK